MTSNTTPTELVAVEQCDRDAAAKLHAKFYRGEARLARSRIRQGKLDRTAIVQEFARHRLASLTPATDASLAAEAVREAAAKVADAEIAARREDQKRDLLDNFLRGQLNTALRLAEQIRALDLSTILASLTPATDERPDQPTGA